MNEGKNQGLLSFAAFVLLLSISIYYFCNLFLSGIWLSILGNSNAKTAARAWARIDQSAGDKNAHLTRKNDLGFRFTTFAFVLVRFAVHSAVEGKDGDR
jgi:hypothetical protein